MQPHTASPKSLFAASKVEGGACPRRRPHQPKELAIHPAMSAESERERTLTALLEDEDLEVVSATRIQSPAPLFWPKQAGRIFICHEILHCVACCRGNVNKPRRSRRRRISGAVARVPLRCVLCRGQLVQVREGARTRRRRALLPVWRAGQWGSRSGRQLRSRNWKQASTRCWCSCSRQRGMGRGPVPVMRGASRAGLSQLQHAAAAMERWKRHRSTAAVTSAALMSRNGKLPASRLLAPPLPSTASSSKRHQQQRCAAVAALQSGLRNFHYSIRFCCR